MVTWFSASAVVPSLTAEWGLTAGGAAWLTASVQLGFVCGAVASAVLNLPDRVPVQVLVCGCSLLAVAATVALAAMAGGLGTALVLRFTTGFALAGVYPPGLKLMASWFDRGRGLALGVLVGSLSLGSALPHLLSSFGRLPWEAVLYAAGGLGVAGAVLAGCWVRPGPDALPAAPFRPGYVVALFRERGPRLANLGYFGHMWELYAVWTWLPSYLAASQAAGGGGSLSPAIVAFLAIGVGGLLGCPFAGWAGDRLGRARTAAGAMAGSATCCLLAAVMFGRPSWMVIAVAMVWGATVIADSGLFSACLTTVVDHRYVGTALTAQTALGFLLTVVTIQAVPLLVQAGGWWLALAVLAVGPVWGCVAMSRLAPLTDNRNREAVFA
ncbi:MFS transporter [Jiangella asiatica]|uniref:MFS transporter n=2 Tax=Jiangella asiatica TaxID=2530372 RepID=A0A4R5DCQ3_9ACTN|nr:MFS transporter [Jiangella asiatica]